MSWLGNSFAGLAWVLSTGGLVRAGLTWVLSPEGIHPSEYKSRGSKSSISLISEGTQCYFSHILKAKSSHKVSPYSKDGKMYFSY
jgi:hypothetical protein